MISVKQAIIVEGKYDKIKLSSIVDGVIIATDGFRIFNDSEKCALIRFFAEKTGIIILTDSDVAGFKIRTHIKSFVNGDNIINVYIPDIFGKEKRKLKPSKEGKLGVEGMNSEILLASLERAGVFNEIKDTTNNIQKIDFYEDGLFGKNNSNEKRTKLIKMLNLPELLTTNSLLEVINAMMTKDEYKKIIKKLNERDGL